MAKIAFRFDIDSHKCIRDGVPILLRISQKYNVPFSFYVNFGRAVSIIDVIKYRKKEIPFEEIKMLSAREKLGNKDYVYAAIRNPKMIKYYENINDIIESGCELGIHGGKNHSHWLHEADRWDYNRVQKEINWSLNMLKKVAPSYVAKGFASPGFVTSNIVNQVLKENGFEYCSNTYSNGENNIVKSNSEIIDIAVNLCGEPGGVAFFEYAQAMGWSDKQTIECFMEVVNSSEKILVFDHPYFAAIQKEKLIGRIIEQLISEQHQIVTVSELLN